MSECVELSDRMPGVARGEAEWTAAEAMHLAACPECRAEWALVRAAIALGRLAPSAGDPAILLAGIRGRLEAARWVGRRYRRWGVRVALAAAAALALVVLRGRVPATSGDSAPRASIFLPELDSLSTDELGAVLRGVERPLTDVHSLDGQGLGDLDDQQLADILQSMEG
ncbi:MAG: hypothetical protein ACHQXA_07440 [Gemmatimonadales bacterium]